MIKNYLHMHRYLDRIIRSNELCEFSEMLQSHHKALLADGKLS